MHVSEYHVAVFDRIRQDTQSKNIIDLFDPIDSKCFHFSIDRIRLFYSICNLIGYIFGNNLRDLLVREFDEPLHILGDMC